jgi:hypothetical protein
MYTGPLFGFTLVNGQTIPEEANQHSAGCLHQTKVRHPSVHFDPALQEDEISCRAETCNGHLWQDPLAVVN